MNLVLDPRDAPFNAIGDNGITDNTDALNAAISAAIASGQILWIGAQFGFVGTLRINGGLKILGSGIGRAGFVGMGGQTQGMISIATDAAVTISDLSIGSFVQMTGGYGILLNGSGPGHQNNFSIFERIIFSQMFTAFDSGSSAYWLFADIQCQGNSPGGYMVRVRNTASYDSGDQTIRNLAIYGGAGVTGIVWNSGGGLKVEGCKFLQIANGMWVNPDAGVQTGLFIIRGNSFDVVTSTGISINAYHSGNSLIDFVIADNVFSGLHLSNANIFASAATGSTVDGFTIVGNHFNNASTNINTTNATNVTIGPNGTG